LRSNIAAEARARIVYERHINFTDDAGTKDALQFLMGSSSGGREPAASCSSFVGCENALNILLDPVAKRIFE
jgi:hypothetical protein